MQKKGKWWLNFAILTNFHTFFSVPSHFFSVRARPRLFRPLSLSMPLLPLPSDP